MSGIVGLALRICAREAALVDATLAEDRVFDSALLPIDKLAGNEPRPFVAFSTEDEDDAPAGRDLNAGSRTIDFVVETAISRTIPLKDGAGAEVIVPDTDGILELTLTVLNRQVTNCLWGRGGGAWGDIFRALAPAVLEYHSRRNVPQQNGARLAARQAVYVLQPVAEPPPGEMPKAGTPLAKFLTQLAADEKLAPMGSIIEHAITGVPASWPAFYTAAAVAAGLTEDEAAGIGITDLGSAGSQPVQSADILPAGWTLDGDAINQALPDDDE